MKTKSKKKSTRKYATKRGVQQQIRRNIETKDHNEYATASEVSSTSWTPICLSDIAQGDTDNSRDGNQIDLFSLQGRVQFRSDPETLIGSQARFIIFQWKPHNGDVAPTAARILFDTTNLSLLSPIIRDRRQTFKILYDSGPVNILPQEAQWVNDTPADDTYVMATPRYKLFNINIGRKKLLNKLIYSAESTEGTNQVYIMFWGGVTAAQSDCPDIQYYLRLLYKDA